MIYIYGFQLLLMLSLGHLQYVRIIPVKMLLSIIPHPDAIFVNFGIISSQFYTYFARCKMVRPPLAVMWNENNIWSDFENQCHKFLLFFGISLTNIAIGKIQFIYIRFRQTQGCHRFVSQFTTC